jgi:hypothetical protein
MSYMMSYYIVYFQSLGFCNEQEWLRHRGTRRWLSFMSRNWGKLLKTLQNVLTSELTLEVVALQMQKELLLLPERPVSFNFFIRAPCLEKSSDYVFSKIRCSAWVVFQFPDICQNCKPDLILLSPTPLQAFNNLFWYYLTSYWGHEVVSLEFFLWFNPPGPTVALGSTQPAIVSPEPLCFVIILMYFLIYPLL